MAETSANALERTPLYDLHVALGARMVPFAGYEMPVQYRAGILAEHRHTRSDAGLFDVSHMGQAWLVGPDHETTARALERLVPGDVAGLKPGAIRYTLLLDASGGIIDDLMVTRPRAAEDDGRLFLVVNASRKSVDYGVIAAGLPENVRLEPASDRALLALQGPKAADVLSRVAPDASGLGFMQFATMEVSGIPSQVSRSGYTGEDGFEISVPGDAAAAVAERLLGEPEAAPIGLGARDSLRLEAGLCLYGHDIDETTSPVEADLVFALSKSRRERGDFPGADRILGELRDGPRRRRIGFAPEGKAPAREGCEIVVDGRTIGIVTSGGFGPTVDRPVGMGYVEAAFATHGTKIELMVRGTARPAEVVSLPFVPHRYFRRPKA